MPGPGAYPQELRERAARMVAEVRPNYESDWAAITAVAAKLEVSTAKTMRKWVRQARSTPGSGRGSRGRSLNSEQFRRSPVPLARPVYHEAYRRAVPGWWPRLRPWTPNERDVPARGDTADPRS
jgi:transposase